MHYSINSYQGKYVAHYKFFAKENIYCAIFLATRYLTAQYFTRTYKMSPTTFWALDVS